MNDLSKFSLEFAPPPDDLQELVSTFYLFAADVEETKQTERADRAQLRFLLKGSGGYEFCDGVYMDAAPVIVIGPTTGPTIGHVQGPLEIFGIGLQPAGWGSLMGADAENHTNRLIDAVSIFGDGVMETHAAIDAAETMAEKAAIGEVFARELLKDAESSPIWFTRVVDEWLTGSASPDINELIERSGLSKRQVERMTKRFYGASPKLLARKYRALRAASLLVRKDGEDGESVEDAFYDQSHLIREIKEFTGVTPGKMSKEPAALTKEVAERRKKLAGKVSKLISDT
ncbi:MAG: helix-turn-helix domain-containing protein [Parasphingopyxis sp.]|uniref:AraC family transcriptional regulator n=1 Tax=Parasphingopyxis sp. TaxID=1920299 RepID=UPI003FA06A18